MTVPLVVAGYLLTRDVDHGSADAITQQVGFNHAEKYQQIHGGKGTGDLVRSVQDWRADIAKDFDEVAQLLDEANAKAGVAWTGQAAEEHGNSLKPMSQFVLDAKDVSTSVGNSAEQQVNNFSSVKNSMPEPVKVDASDSLLDKAGAWLTGSETDLQKQEQQATEAAQQAKQVYDNYGQNTSNVSQGLAYYPQAPQTTFDAGSGGYGSGTAVGSGTGAGGGGSHQPVGGSGMHVGGGAGAGTGGGLGNGPGAAGYAGTPAGSESAWATPPSTTTGGMAGPGAFGTGSGTGGSTGWGGMLPGGFGAGSGAGAGGAGAGGRGGLGSAGRAGMAAEEAASRSGAAGRPGSSGVAGAGARGKGQEGEDDLEHENKYMIDTDEAWDDLGLPHVAPPVLGEWKDQ